MAKREDIAVMNATLALAARAYITYVHDGVTPENVAKLRELAAAGRLLRAMGIDVLDRVKLEEVARG